MAKVYVSSTRLDLEPERQAVIDWLVQADHQPRHSYVPDSHTVRDGCLNDVSGCDAYVLILGHRYGHVPQDRNPEGYSITELEYRCAVAEELPCVVLTPKGVRNIAVTDLVNPAVYARVQAFAASVHAAHKAGQFGDVAELIAALSAGLQKALRNDPLEDPEVQRVIARLTVQNAGKEDQILSLQTELQQVRTQLAEAVARTLGNAAAPGASAAAVNAAQALRRGDTEPAEALLRTQELAAVQSAESEGDVAAKQAERRRAATLARERGALALQHDVRSALAAYRQATEYEPEDVWSWYVLGDLYIATGDLAAAGHSYREAQRHGAAALEAQPDSEQRQRDLSVSHNRIGDVLVAQGDLPAALAAFRTSLDIARALAARDPGNTEWQRDLSVSHNKIGDVLVSQGDLGAALAAFRTGLDIHQALAAREPGNTQWQRDLSVSHNKIGDVLVAQGDMPAALAAFRTGVDIRQALAARDPGNTKWQRDLSVSRERIGDVLVSQGDLGAALAAFRTGLDIRQALAARDPGNTEWQRDLSVSHNKIGDVLVAQGDLPTALAAFCTSLDIRQALAARDPANAQWQADVAASCSRMGGCGALSRDDRREHLQRGLDILTRLHDAGHLPPNQDRRVWFTHRLDELADPPSDESAGTA